MHSLSSQWWRRAADPWTGVFATPEMGARAVLDGQLRVLLVGTNRRILEVCETLVFQSAPTVAVSFLVLRDNFTVDELLEGLEGAMRGENPPHIMDFILADCVLAQALRPPQESFLPNSVLLESEVRMFDSICPRAVFDYIEAEMDRVLFSCEFPEISSGPNYRLVGHAPMESSPLVLSPSDVRPIAFLHGVIGSATVDQGFARVQGSRVAAIASPIPTRHHFYSAPDTSLADRTSMYPNGNVFALIYLCSIAGIAPKAKPSLAYDIFRVTSQESLSNFVLEQPVIDPFSSFVFTEIPGNGAPGIRSLEKMTRYASQREGVALSSTYSFIFDSIPQGSIFIASRTGPATDLLVEVAADVSWIPGVSVGSPYFFLGSKRGELGNAANPVGNQLVTSVPGGYSIIYTRFSVESIDGRGNCGSTLIGAPLDEVCNLALLKDSFLYLLVAMEASHQIVQLDSFQCGDDEFRSCSPYGFVLDGGAASWGAVETPTPTPTQTQSTDSGATYARPCCSYMAKSFRLSTVPLSGNYSIFFSRESSEQVLSRAFRKGGVAALERYFVPHDVVLSGRIAAYAQPFSLDVYKTGSGRVGSFHQLFWNDPDPVVLGRERNPYSYDTLSIYQFCTSEFGLSEWFLLAREVPFSDHYARIRVVSCRARHAAAFVACDSLYDPDRIVDPLTEKYCGRSTNFVVERQRLAWVPFLVLQCVFLALFGLLIASHLEIRKLGW